MTWGTERVGAALFLAGLVALLCVAGVTAYLTHSLDETAAVGARMSDWRQANFELMDAAQNADAGQRGYLLTGDHAYLEMQNEAVRTLPARLEVMRAMTPADERQQHLFARAEGAIRGKLEEIAATTNLKAAGRDAEALAIINAQDSKAHMDAVRGSLRELADYQTSNLMDLRAKSSQRRQWLLVGATLALGLSMLLLSGALIAAFRQLRLLRAREAQLSINNEMLEQLVRERTEGLERATQDLQRESEQMQALLAEINHRVGNSMQMVSSFLGLQAEKMEHPEAREALDSARARVQAMASAQRRLRLTGTSDIVKVDQLLENLVADIRQAMSEDERVDILVDAEPADAPSRDAISIGVILNELVTNALKYAFPDQRTGRIAISLKSGKDRLPLRLTIEDDGVGLPATRRKSGLGLDVVTALAMSLDASVKTEPVNDGGPNRGARIILTFATQHEA